MQRSGGLAKIHQALQPALSEMFFASKITFTEGLEDIAYIATYLHLLEMWNEYRRLGFHMVPVEGESQLLQPLAIAKCLQIPTLVVFDSDGDKPDKNGSRKKHEVDNLAILKLCEVPDPAPFPTSHLWSDHVVMWATDIEKTVESEIGNEDWATFRAQADKEYGHTAGLRKNTLHIATSLLLAWQEGKKSSSLDRLCNKIIQFGKSGN